MIRPVLIAMALTAARAVFAQTYIVPDTDCGAVTFHATHATDFPNLGDTIAADRVKDAYVFVPRQRVAIKPAAGGRSLDFKANVGPDDGVVMASVNFTPAISGSETRTDHAKAFVFCGPNTPISEWQRETKLGLEIYPQSWNGRRPQMKAGDPMRFIVVDTSTGKAKLLGDIPMELYRAGGTRVDGAVHDKLGGTDFPYPGPGLYMVSTTYRRADADRPEQWLVDTSTLTFEIK